MSWFHRHRWEPVGVHAGMTLCVVLYRCDCGKTKTEDVDGVWTLEQLRGEA